MLSVKSERCYFKLTCRLSISKLQRASYKKHPIEYFTLLNMQKTLRSDIPLPLFQKESWQPLNCEV